MTTLRIEHPVTSYEAWKDQFDRFAGLRAEAGVTGHRLSQPADDANYVLIDLEFDDAERATRFLGILRERIWPNPENAPALIGDPVTRILETVDAG
jgi:hypothetical protein